MLYRPLADDVAASAALLRFGLRDNRRDLRDVRWRWRSVVAVIGLPVPIMTGVVLGDFVPAGRRDLVVEGSLVVIGSALVVAALTIVQNIAVLRLEGRSICRDAGRRLEPGCCRCPPRSSPATPAGELGTTVPG